MKLGDKLKVSERAIWVEVIPLRRSFLLGGTFSTVINKGKASDFGHFSPLFDTFMVTASKRNPKEESENNTAKYKLNIEFPKVLVFLALRRTFTLL